MTKEQNRQLFRAIAELQDIKLSDRWQSALLGGAIEQLLELADEDVDEDK